MQNSSRIQKQGMVPEVEAHQPMNLFMPGSSSGASLPQHSRQHLALKRNLDIGDDDSDSESESVDLGMQEAAMNLLGQDKKEPPLKKVKKTRGRVKIKMEFIDDKLRRYTTFSKRKTGLMKKAYELSTLTGTEVLLLVASETGHVYTFATRKLQPMITSDSGKALIQTCLNSPDANSNGQLGDDVDVDDSDQGFGEYELAKTAAGSLGMEALRPGAVSSQDAPPLVTPGGTDASFASLLALPTPALLMNTPGGSSSMKNATFNFPEATTTSSITSASPSSSKSSSEPPTSNYNITLPVSFISQHAAGK